VEQRLVKDVLEIVNADADHRAAAAGTRFVQLHMDPRKAGEIKKAAWQFNSCNPL
jgi:hypothetical protein